MSAPNQATNPYSDEEPTLHQAWEEGRRAGHDGRALPKAQTHNDPNEAEAWLDGYATAQTGEAGRIALSP